MEFCHQWLWPELDVQFSSVSEQWAQFSVAGPRSRDVLRRIVDPPARHLQRGVPLHGGRRADRHGRPPGAPVPHLLLGRAGLRDRRAGGLWRRADPAHHGGGPRVRHRALRHRGARRHAHREGPRRRQRDQRADHRARPGARPHDVDQEGLHRPRHGAAPGAARRRTGRRFAGFKPVDRADAAAGRRPFHSPRARSRSRPTTRAT